jgi:hypothetical protein
MSRKIVRGCLSFHKSGSSARSAQASKTTIMTPQRLLMDINSKTSVLFSIGLKGKVLRTI